MMPVWIHGNASRFLELLEAHATCFLQICRILSSPGFSPGVKILVDRGKYKCVYYKRLVLVFLPCD